MAELIAIARLAMPIMLGQSAQFGATTIDNVLAGHLDARVLGAVAVGAGIWLVFAVLVIGLLLAVPPLVSALDGAGRRQEVALILPQAVTLGIGAGLACGLALFAFGPRLIDAAGIAPSLRPGAAAFLEASAFGLPGIGLFSASRGISEGLSRTMPSMLIQFAGLVLLAPVGYVLMYGRFGVPPLGALGSGIATALSFGLQGAAYFAYVRLSPSYRGLDRSRLAWRPDLAVLGRMLRLGVPIAATLGLEVGMFSTASLVVASLGPDAIAGSQIALNVVTIAFLVPLGIANAVTVRVGGAIGRADPAAIGRAVACGLVMGIAFECVSVCVLLALRFDLVGLYSPDPAVIRIGAALLVFGAVFQIPDGIQVICAGALRGMRDTRAPMWITLFGYWVIGMPLGAGLALRVGLGAEGMWTGLIAGLLLVAVLLGARVRNRTRQRQWMEVQDPQGPGGAPGQSPRSQSLSTT